MNEINRSMNIINNLLDYIRCPEIYKFLVVGICAAISTLSLTILFTSIIGMYYVISVAIAFEITLIWGFFAHDRWTFSSVPKSTKPIIRFIKYNIFSIAGLGVNEVVLVFFTQFVKFHYSISEIIAIMVAFLFNYLVHKKISWKN